MGQPADYAVGLANHAHIVGKPVGTAAVRDAPCVENSYREVKLKRTGTLPDKGLEKLEIGREFMTYVKRMSQQRFATGK